MVGTINPTPGGPIVAPVDAVGALRLFSKDASRFGSNPWSIAHWVIVDKGGSHAAVPWQPFHL